MLSLLQILFTDVLHPKWIQPRHVPAACHYSKPSDPWKKIIKKDVKFEGSLAGLSELGPADTTKILRGLVVKAMAYKASDPGSIPGGDSFSSFASIRKMKVGQGE